MSKKSKSISKLILLGILITSTFIVPTWAMDTEALYKVKEYDDKGKIRITFKHTPKGETQPKKYELVSVSPEDVDKIVEIRCSPEVYKHYTDHKKPTVDSVKSTFEKTLLPRVKQENSLFPFALQEVVKTPALTPQKTHNTIGFFNIGSGFSANDRMYGYYMDKGCQGKGIGSKAVKVSTHFVMQFHQNASHTLTITPKKSVGKPYQAEVKKTYFSGNVSATCDTDNLSSFIPLTKAGLVELSAEAIEKKGFTNNVKSKIQINEETGEMKDITKRYLEMTWDQFKENEAKGMYKQ